MPLPYSALQRLALPLREAKVTSHAVGNFHSVPIGQFAWGERAAAFAHCIEEVAASGAPPVSDFNASQVWVARLLNARSLAIEHLLSLEPFEPFGKESATVRLRLLDEAVDAAVVSLENVVPLDLPSQGLRDNAAWWRGRPAAADAAEALQRAFGVPEVPVDDGGEFRADWVLQHYAYRSGDLLRVLLPHLASLGVPGVTDVLAAVTIVGLILNCGDPVVAYAEMSEFSGCFLAAPTDVAGRVSTHLEASEAALRRARQAAKRARVEAVTHPHDIETRAMAVVDAYASILEGPFRQFSWGLHCLRRGTWGEPPMVTGLRDQLLAAGGNLGVVAKSVIIPDIRNSHAHQTLEWDGYAEEFVTERARISPIDVARALNLADCFVKGCEAGLAAVRSLDILHDDNPLPRAVEPGRLPSWRRVQAFFGTNRLRLTDARLNARHASIRVRRLGFTDINPCFQALILARRLLPNVETFSVATEASDLPLIVVSVGALDAAMPVWEFAVSSLDQMPLSVFLPVNYDARTKVEELSVALRSVAWIAIDDALGIVDGSPDDWGPEVQRLVDARLRILEMAVDETANRLDGPAPRLQSVLDSVRQLRHWMQAEPRPSVAKVDRQPAMGRLRLQWERWGPVRRHPLICNEEAPDLSVRQPALRELPESFDYLTL